MKKDIQTIEQTSKKWKGLKIISVIFILLGIFSIPVGDVEGPVLIIKMILLLFGLGLLVYASFMSWWHHS